MFQFGRFPSISRWMTALEHRRVSPFGYLRLLRSYTPHRRFSQYNTSFIGTRRLGIHCVPLLAFRTIVRSLRLSWHALLGITFALIIRFLRRTEPPARDDSPIASEYYRECCARVKWLKKQITRNQTLTEKAKRCHSSVSNPSMSTSGQALHPTSASSHAWDAE